MLIDSNRGNGDEGDAGFGGGNGGGRSGGSSGNGNRNAGWDAPGGNDLDDEIPF
ncbi:hypothetical protein AA3266_2726 [Gluconobacter kondonii NBRC 3266]|nr:hypothetical protein AA3266_2726 [Gluconobacter kondonii NBRC 3266]